MIAWLERDEHGRAARAVTGVSQRDDFGVRLAELRVESLSHRDAVTNDDGADHRVRRRLPPTALRERECPAHPRALIALAPGCRVFHISHAIARYYRPKRRPSVK
jgi:hypothetical protein